MGTKNTQLSMKSIVSIKWLKENLEHPNLVVLYSNLGDKITPTQYIPKSKLFDIKKVFSNTSSTFPNTFPAPDDFQKKCSAIGINKDSIIVVYDSRNTFSSPRVWWMFKTMGHKNITVLDGGLTNWITNDFSTQTNLTTSFEQGNFESDCNEDGIKLFEFIQQNIQTQTALVIDARSNDRFTGITPETRVGLRSGHIPNAINIPYTTVLDNGKFKSTTALQEIFKNIPTQKKLVFSCGSGVTACVVLLAAQQVLKNEMAIYDGSWTEWATLSNL